MTLKSLKVLKPDDISLINSLLDKHSVKLRLFKKKNYPLGYADFMDRSININVFNSRSRKIVLSTFFHELSHFMREKIAPKNYLACYGIVNLTTSVMTKNAILGLYKEELLTDRLAEVLFKKHYPQLKYSRSYTSPKSNVEFLLTINEILFWKLNNQIFEQAITEAKVLAKKYGWSK